MVSELLAGNIYVNVHTAANAPGEIRGQVNSPDVITSVERIEEGVLPDDFVLFQNFPNPFNPTTEIRFDLNQSGQAVLKVFNLLGQHVATLVNENLPGGSYRVTFDSRALPSGVYVYQLQSGGQSQVRKMLLLR